MDSKNERELSTFESDFCKNYDYDLWRQDSPDLKSTNLQTSDDFTRFVIFLEHIKKKQGNFRAQEEVAGDDDIKDEKTNLKDIMMDNLYEIQDLREMIKESPSEFF